MGPVSLNFCLSHTNTKNVDLASKWEARMYLVFGFRHSKNYRAVEMTRSVLGRIEFLALRLLAAISAAEYHCPAIHVYAICLKPQNSPTPVRERASIQCPGAHTPWRGEGVCAPRKGHTWPLLRKDPGVARILALASVSRALCKAAVLLVYN